MQQTCWIITKERGFLMNPDPIADLRMVETPLSSETTGHLQALAEQVPSLIASRQMRRALVALPVYDMTPLREVDDFRIVERCFQIYAHFANAYVWCENENPMNHIPAGVAVPLVQLAKMVERPPIIPYAMTALSNYQRLDPAGDIVVDNLRCVQKLIDIPDESWFHLTHIEIEAHAAGAIHHCLAATRAVINNDAPSVEAALAEIPPAMEKMISTFKRIPQGCSPNVYYHTLRPYLFGFDDIIYQGVSEFGGVPQTFRGETGAQSTVIPAIQRFLGLRHQRGGLSEHLEIMKAYMPKPHRDLLNGINQSLIRQFVITQQQSTLRDAYNACLERVVAFRSLHLHFANAYIATKVKDPRGTGGTEFMHWLKQLRDETEQQYI